MLSTNLTPSPASFHFHRFLSSGLCRAVARVLIVTLLLMDATPRRTAADSEASVPLVNGLTRYVNSDGVCQGQSPCYQTIQAAIDAAQAGDTIRVQAGEYDEALKIKKKQQLTVEADPTLPEGSVVLNSVSQRCRRGDVITIDTSTNITLRGFTITDAGGQAIEIKGGKPKKHSDHILIERNRIFGNGTSKCQGGIRVGANTPDTIILNNLLYGNGQDAIRFLGGKGGPHYVVQNVIHGNRRDGINVTKGQTVVIVNNVITHNGTDPKPPTQLYGIRRPAPKKKGRTENAQLLHNLICGNTQGELFGPMLDGLDAGNLTPTGSEGPGVSASAQCADLGVVYANLNGPDGQPNTQDDDFTLAIGSPGVDAGTDPRTQGMPIPDANLEQDFFRDAIRPGGAGFDMGAIEGPRAGAQCVPATTQACYEGPAGTQDVGLCRGGTKTCQSDGTYGACVGQVLPSTELCDSQDNDCDGQVDEGGVCPVNQPPDITSTPILTGHVGQLYSYDVNATDPDAGDTLVYSLTTNPTGMTINSNTGVIEWTPSTAGPHDVTVQVSDGKGGVDTQSFTIQVAAPQSAHAPVALGNSYELRADQTLTVPAPGVLGNDSDADGDALTAIKLSDPTKGALSFYSNGSFSFVPNPAALVCTGTPAPTGVSFIEPLATSFATPSGEGVVGLAKGDFDHDGAIDLAFTWYDNVPGVGERSFVSIMLGNGDASFQPPVLIHSVEPGYGRGLLVKDFDDDGKLDLLVAAGEARQLLLFKGQGDGSFASPTAIATTHRPDTLQSADVNNDNTPDLITTNGGDNSVSVLLGNGDGTFQSPTNYTASHHPTEAVIGDVNGDLAPDLVVGSIAHQQFDVLLNKNDGSGGFQPPRGFNPRMQITGLYLADFNGDGRLDVVASGAGCAGPQTSGTGCMVFIPGNGDGTFPVAQDSDFVGLDSDFPVRRFTENLTPDLNNDGKLDVIFLGGFQGSVNQAFVGLGNGDGTFTLTRYVMSPGPAVAPNRQPVSAPVDNVYGYPVVAADFNGDGVIDLATGNIGRQRPGGVSLLPGATPGTFAAPRSFPIAFNLGLVGRRSLVLGDFTNDGQPELAVLAVNRIGLVPLNNDGSLGNSSLMYETPAPGEFSNTLRAGDFDRDGNLDVLWLGTGGIQGGPSGRILVGFGDGTGHLAQVLAIPNTTGQLRNSVIEDFNEDGFPDFAVYKWAPTPTEVEVYLSDGVTRTFSVLSPAGGGTLGAGSDNEHGMVAADFDHDEHLDIVLSIGVEGQSGGNPQRSIFLKGNGDGTFQPGVIIASGLSGGIYDYVAGDINHDGALDLVGNGIYSNAHVQLGKGDGAFQAPVTYYAGTGGNSGTALADFDRDGNLDIAISGDNFGWGFVVLAGNGDGTFDAGQKFAVGQRNAHDLAVMDLNHDGKADVIVGHGGQHGNRLTVLLNNANSGRLCTHTDSFTYKANDGGRDSNTATVNLTIRLVNHAPVITSTPVTQADTRRPYFYDVEAGDSDGGVLAFALAAAPSGMTINPDTGVIRWIPSSNQAGNRAVTVRVYDEEGLFDEQSFTVTVTTQLIVPNVVGQTQAAAEATLTSAGFTVGTITTRYSATAPAGTVISQTPAAGLSVAQNTAVNLVVSLGPLVVPGLTSITVAPSNPVVLVGGSQTFTATGVLNDGSNVDVSEGVRWDSGSTSVATISSFGVATGVAEGSSTITATLGSVSGNTTLNVRARVTGDTTLPTAAITAPADGAEVTSPIGVIGTATDDNFFRYELSYALAGETNFTLLSSGSSPVSNGVLGQFDPTLLINDLYDLKLTVFDLGGNETSTMVTVQVARDMKVGLFTITFQDLQIPLSGIPITINRTYDSRDKGKGDFGIGWRLDIQTLRIRPNREQGSGWVVNRSGGAFGAFSLAPVGQHKVSLTLPGGKVEEFDMVLNPTVSPLVPLQTTTVSYIPRPGTLGSLIPLGDNDVLVVGDQPGEVTLTTFDGNTYNPTRFRYIQADGSMIDIDRTKGVEKVRDLNGNTLTFETNGITHSSGKSVTFTRDAQGRITQMTDPAGNSQSYAYNVAGDLVNHADQAGNITQFTYNSTHGLLQITDPLNRPSIRNEYSADGRLTATTSATGRRITFAHDLNTRQEIITDVDGNITVAEYDEKGNIVRVTDPLGGVTSSTYDALGNHLTTTNALGQTTTRTFDARRNKVSESDPLGHTTVFTYNARDQLTARTDALGRTTTLTYDSAGNRLSRIVGGVTQEVNVYDAQGNMLSQTDAVGATTRFEYDAFGHLTAQIDALGNRSEFAYDANGNPLTEKDRRGQVVATTFDARGLVTTKQDSLGNIATFAYDALGNLTAVTDAAGNRVESAYDAAGRPTSDRNGVGNTSTRQYDAKGRLTHIITATGQSTAFEYDVLDRPVKKILPGGAFELTQYDAIGRTIAKTDANGNTTQFTYDAAGRNISTTDALGNTTRFEYDAVGNLTKRIDALGNVFTFTYDALNRQTAIGFPDGSTESYGYDAAGHRTSVTDAMGRTTRFAYDGRGNLVKVTDAAGGETTYTYDEENNLLTQRDANGHTTTFDYDANGRRVRATYPNGTFETETYDTASNVSQRTTRRGDTIANEFDAARRLTAKVLPGGTRVEYSYTPTGKIARATNATGTTIYSYDEQERLARVDNPDGSFLSYTYDAVGNRTSVVTKTSASASAKTTTYAYDALNRLVSVTDSAGRVTTYGYDAIGNQTQVNYPNGTSTLFSYNSKSFLRSIEYRRGAVTLEFFTYTTNAVGDHTRVDARDGSFVEYEYDALRRLTREVRHDTAGTVVDEFSYSYDSVGNRLTKTLRSGATTLYVYDANDQLVSAGGVTFGYDANGNTISRTESGQVTRYTYDTEDRLVQATTPGGETTSYVYNALDQRRQVNGPAGTINYLVDPNNLTGVSQVLEEYGPGGIPLTSYVYGNQLISQDRGGTASFYHRDATNSIRFLTNTAGNVTDQYTFDAFGQQLARTGTTASDYLFAGEQFDPGSGLYYVRARYYSAETGRFVSVDPFAGSQTDPASLHRYLYAHANPITFSDPTGQFTVPNLAQAALAGALISAVISIIVDTVEHKSPKEIIANVITNGIIGGVSAALGVGAAAGTAKLLSSAGISFAVQKGFVLVCIASAKAAASTLVSMAKFAYDTKEDAAAGKPTASFEAFVLLAGFTFTVNFAFELFFLGVDINTDVNAASKKILDEATKKAESTGFFNPSDLYRKFAKGSGDDFLEFFQDATNLPYISKVLNQAGTEFNTVLDDISTELVKRLAKRLSPSNPTAFQQVYEGFLGSFIGSDITVIGSELEKGQR